MMLIASKRTFGTLLAFAAGLASLTPQRATACGCFAPPDPSVPIVQAGERILFGYDIDKGEVIAHIQIQYQGKPAEFGWLLPLPSIPTNRKGRDGIDLGVDELFQQLTSTTQPKYRLLRSRDSCPGDDSNRSADMGVFLPPSPTAGNGPLLVRDAIGPYDFAILKADSKDAVFDWLRSNRFFVPAGTESASAPYVRPGAYFLALKLRAGQSTGDLQPVVLRYKSDLPMIPIVLTSVAATPNMGIQVFMLGTGRAIPRNYYHTVINDAHIDWLNAGRNYNDVIIRAIGEAKERHSFVTEYAGTSGIMRGVLDPAGRFALEYLTQLEHAAAPVDFARLVLVPGQFSLSRPAGPFGPPGPLFVSLDGQVLAILSRHIPLPQALADEGVQLSQYYQQLDYYLGEDRKRNPDKYTDIEAALRAFDPLKATAELRQRVVEPTQQAAALFTQHRYLTRLYTTLSPEDMTKDPVFSYNPGLPDYSNIHEAMLTTHCDGTSTLLTENGWYIKLERDMLELPVLPLPYSLRIEILRETGAPEVVTDNTNVVHSMVGTPPPPTTRESSSGCRLVRSSQPAFGTLLLLLGCIGFIAIRRQSRA